MPDDHPFDAEIAARYLRGESTSTIARSLGLRLPTVIGRVREMNLRPPQVQPARVEAPDEVPAPAADAVQPPARGESGTATSKVALLAGSGTGPDSGDDEGEGFVRRDGRPPGWLVTEAELDRMFAGDRYEDVRLKDDERTRYNGYLAAKRTSNPVVFEAARRAYHSK